MDMDSNTGEGINHLHPCPRLSIFTIVIRSRGQQWRISAQLEAWIAVCRARNRRWHIYCLREQTTAFAQPVEQFQNRDRVKGNRLAISILLEPW